MHKIKAEGQEMDGAGKGRSADLLLPMRRESAASWEHGRVGSCPVCVYLSSENKVTCRNTISSSLCKGRKLPKSQVKYMLDSEQTLFPEGTYICCST